MNDEDPSQNPHQPNNKTSLKYDYEYDSEESSESEESEDSTHSVKVYGAAVGSKHVPSNSYQNTFHGNNIWAGPPPRNINALFFNQRPPISRPRFFGPSRPTFRHHVPAGFLPNTNAIPYGNNRVVLQQQTYYLDHTLPPPQYQQNIAQPQIRPQQPYNNPVNASNKSQGYGIGHHKIVELCDALDEKKILIGSADLMKAVVQDNTFYKRLDNLWEEYDTKKRVDFLRIISAITMTSQNEFQHYIHEFMNKVLMSSLIKTIVNQISGIPYNPQMQIPLYGDLIKYIVEIMFAGFDLIPSKMLRHLLEIQSLIATVEKPMNDFLSFETKEMIEKLKKVYEDAQKNKAQQAQNLRNIKKIKYREFQGSLGQPPTDFRQLSIIPTAADLSPNYRPYLRVAKIKGQYESDEHYLDVQFRLLREDLIQPLRMGIADYKAGNPDVFVYKNVFLDELSLHPASGNFIHYANIRVTRQIEYGKAMKHNSLLCLSPDNFQEIFLFAIVQDRNAECLKQGKIGIKFEGDDEIDISLYYNIVESPAFFEAYRHVMATLQYNKSGAQLPFSKYLVKVETEIDRPKYLKANSTIHDIYCQQYNCNELHFNFSCILTDDAKEKLLTTSFSPYFLNSMNPIDFGMNKSQFAAFSYALQSELAIIQGPPGTGKSYLGLQIAKLLLDSSNWNIWNSENDERPLLVVCYTNHALDQFLEGIYNFMDDGIVRVGGRSKNPILQNFMLYKLRPAEASKASRIGYSMLRGEVDSIWNEILECKNILKQCEIRLISNEMLQSVRKYHFMGPSFTDESFLKWLTLFDKQNNAINFDVKYIRSLIKWGIDESTAKSAYAYACHNKINVDAAELFRKLNTGALKDIPSFTENDDTKDWPNLDAFDEVVKMGYPEKVALALLQSSNSNINIIKEEQKSFKEINKVDSALAQNNMEKSNVSDASIEKEDQENDESSDEESLDIVNEENYIKTKKFKEWKPPKEMEVFCPFITAASPMSEEEKNDLPHSIEDLPLQMRWRLYQSWISEIQELIKQAIKKLETHYSEKKRLLIERNTFVDSDILKRAKVVGMTTTGAAKYQSTLLSIRPRIVIAEEAAEVLEAHIITSLTEACEHLILIGDHQQLRPIPAVYELARKYNLEISLFERLINNNYPYAKLDTQHRMRPEISRVLMPHFYQNLLDDVSVENLPNVKGMTKNLLFINHLFPETSEHIDGSHKNQYEVEYSLRLALYLLQQGYESNQITILCTYLDQYLALRNKSNFILGAKHGVRIENVDNYQGEECDIIILSLVRSNNQEKKIGFLNIPNRVCVALSRAKQGLYVIGNISFLAENCELWADIKRSVEHVGALSNKVNVKCQMHGIVQTINHFNDFGTKCIEGGCQSRCNTRLKCGHTCPRPCHGMDIDHEIDLCQKRCARLCPLEHPCKKLCNEPCDPCKVVVIKAMSCGHEIKTLCHIPLDEIFCDQPCNRNLKCGHKCRNKCGGTCNTYCPEKIVVKLPSCGHTVTINCGDNLTTYKCPAAVTKTWPTCNHTVTTACHINPAESPCPKLCNAKFEDCEHLCQGTCGSCDRGRLHIPCNKACNRLLICGHKCNGKCGKVCEPCRQPCQTACGHSKCGSTTVKQMKIRWMANEENKTTKKTGRLCYEACPPCMEKCQNQCEHQKCEMKCSQKCNIELCMKPCRKMLQCGFAAQNSKKSKSQDHFCIGICHGNEACLQICKTCSPRKYNEIKKPFFGNEQNDDSCFVMLDNCKHVFEVTGLDNYIKESTYIVNKETRDREIVRLKCPKCKAPILTSRRYHSYISQQAEDIEAIKQILCNFGQDKNKQEQFCIETEKIIESLKNSALFDADNLVLLKKGFYKAPHSITPNWIKAAENCKKILANLKENGEMAEKNQNIEIPKNLEDALNESFDGGIDSYLKKKYNTLIVACANIPNSNTIFQQLVQESDRFALLAFLIILFKYLLANSPPETSDETNSMVKSFIEILKKALNENSFTKEIEKSILNQFTLLYDEETHPNELVIEKYSTSNRWYKKENGDYFTK